MALPATSSKTSKIVLGIDPGFGRLGYALVSGTLTHPVLIEAGYIQTKGTNHGLRLSELRDKLTSVIARHQPTSAAIERLFFSVNVKTALKVAEARGVVMELLTTHKLPVLELSPQAVKMAATGQGNADKKQVQKMLCLIFKLKQAPKPDDAADALAVALCGLSINN
ncbi:MAG: crossover junction endodeoxyribonuclease RuvC [Candidatus Kerfeldbacteria bacterium]|nr:crossover junction endodeoxyribonuclease RuvC [Candidatus Kerfeldbacteria bacterium]